MLAFMVASPAMALRSDGLLELVKAELRPSSYLLKSPSAAPKIEEACKNLEAEGTRPAWPRDLMLLDGRWKLVYSSALALPLPPIEPISGPLAGLLEELPFAPREVEQRIDVEQRRVINVVRLSAWPSGGPAQLLSALPGIGGAISALQSAIVQLELDHNFRVEGEGGSSGGLRKAAAGSVVELQLEQLRRTLAKQEDAESDDWDDGWNDMLNPQVRLPSFYSLLSLRFLRFLDATLSSCSTLRCARRCERRSGGLPRARRRLATRYWTPCQRRQATSFPVRSAPLPPARSTRRTRTRRCASPAAARSASFESLSASVRRGPSKRCTRRGRRRRTPWRRRRRRVRNSALTMIDGRRAALTRQRRWTLRVTTRTLACQTREPVP